MLHRLAIRAKTPEGGLYLVMPPTADALEHFGELFCASMHASSEKFVLAFRDMWSATFKGAKGLQYPLDVQELLKGLREINLGVEADGLPESQDLFRLEVRCDFTQLHSSNQDANNPLLVDSGNAGSAPALNDRLEQQFRRRFDSHGRRHDVRRRYLIRLPGLAGSAADPHHRAAGQRPLERRRGAGERDARHWRRVGSSESRGGRAQGSRSVPLL